MRKLAIAVAAVAMTMAACQKEGSQETGGTSGGGTGGTTPTGLLVRQVTVYGADSVTNAFSYDASKRLMSVAYTTTQGGNSSTRFVRNNTGVVTQTIIKSDDLSTIGLDSLVSNLFSRNGQQYAYSVSSFVLNSVSIRDSVAYSYDGAGNLIMQTGFVKGTATPYQMISQTEYTYAAGNVAVEKTYSFDQTANKLVLDGTYTYTYDNKTNPLKIGVEALIGLADASYVGANNVTKADFVDPTDQTNNYSVTSSYTYNASNKPSSGTGVQTPGPNNFTLRYYYN